MNYLIFKEKDQGVLKNLSGWVLRNTLILLLPKMSREKGFRTRGLIQSGSDRMCRTRRESGWPGGGGAR